MLQNIGSAQLLSQRPQLLAKSELTNKLPTDFAGIAALTFVDLAVLFDGGSYGAEFRRDNGHCLVIIFPHPGYWTKEAIKNSTQPIAILVDRKGKPDLEIKRDSPFERRVIKLLNDDLSNKEHSRKQIKTLTRVSDCIRDRKPLREIRKRFHAAFKD